MLQNPSKQIRMSLRNAEQCATLAKIERDPNLVRDFLDFERRWVEASPQLSILGAARNLFKAQ
jgi:hypothetical protein